MRKSEGEFNISGLVEICRRCPSAWNTNYIRRPKSSDDITKLIVLDLHITNRELSTNVVISMGGVDEILKKLKLTKVCTRWAHIS